MLSDGVLFDVSSGKQIHKLDKLNQTQSGVFHPNGLEVGIYKLKWIGLLHTSLIFLDSIEYRGLGHQNIPSLKDCARAESVLGNIFPGEHGDIRHLYGAGNGRWRFHFRFKFQDCGRYRLF